MKKRRKMPVYKTRHQKAATWLPIDSRLFPFFSFSHVRGVARIFLIIEMVMATAVVLGTFILVLITLLQ